MGRRLRERRMTTLVMLRLEAPRMITAVFRGLRFDPEGVPFGVFDPKRGTAYTPFVVPLFEGDLAAAVEAAAGMSAAAREEGRYMALRVQAFPPRYFCGATILALDRVRVEVGILDPDRYNPRIRK